MLFVPARWFRSGGNLPVSRIVIHDMEYPEKPDAAEAVARMFQTSERKASAHYCVDNNSIVRCVNDHDTAFHAPPNQHSIGIEHAGYARQTTGDWLDDYGTAMLRDQSAPLVRGLCAKYDVPKVWLNVDDLVAGKHGITSHWNVSLAFSQSTHTDPGPNFPVAEYMAWVVGPPPLPLPIPNPILEDTMYLINPTADDAKGGPIYLLLPNQSKEVGALFPLTLAEYEGGYKGKLPQLDLDPAAFFVLEERLGIAKRG